MTPGLDPELRGTDRLFALLALIDERLQRVESKVDASAHDHEQRIAQLELNDAKREGALSILRWAVPGGPALVLLIGAAAAWYAQTH